MNKKYQVFVSSTFQDLREERWKTLLALISSDCIPSGMEWFPAIDQDLFEYIKQRIDGCDYYLLIIGGKYGSLAEEGISYTEKEYDYAIQKGLKVIALIHESPETLPEDKKEIDPERWGKLEKFIEKVRNKRLPGYWKTSEEIAHKAIIALNKMINDFPATGWVRENTISNETLFSEMNALRKENNALRETNLSLETEIQKLKAQQKPDIDNLAALDEEFEIEYYDTHSYSESQKRAMKITWEKLFGLLSPKLITAREFHKTKLLLESSIREKSIVHNFLRCKNESFETIIFQFTALGLITCQQAPTTINTMAVFCQLTKKGEQWMLESKTIKKK